MPNDFMDIQEIAEQLKLSENAEWEFKAASGGLPVSLWETYSAMANTNGGTIVLGIREHQGVFEIQGVSNTDKLKKVFWDTIHNPTKVNINLLQENDVSEACINGKGILIIQIPRASRRLRPVYLKNNPLEGTYRRSHEGDYRCQPDEVKRMLSDQSEIPFDSKLLEFFTEKDIDNESLQQYRNRFSARDPHSPWLKENNVEFLRKLGGWALDRQTGKQGPTIAGILMFGTEDAIQDLNRNFLKYNVDYRERVSDRIADRWSDRITIDGSWTPNLFQYFQRVYPKLTAGLKLPFAYLPQSPLFPDPVRTNVSPVHEAIQEALVNALVHADYSGQGGIVIERFADRFEMSNPGTLLISLEQLYQGAVSECRNPSLQKMFQLMGAGDKAGAGFDKIRNGWSSQQWQSPQIKEKLQPDRVELCLNMTSLLPDGFVANLQKALGDDFQSLDREDIQIIAIASSEGKTSNSQVQDISAIHSYDITKKLQNLVSKNLLIMHGYGRWATYSLAPKLKELDFCSQTLQEQPSLPKIDPSLAPTDPSLSPNDPSLAPTDPGLSDLSKEELLNLQKIGDKIRLNSKMSSQAATNILKELCRNQFLTASQIAILTGRNVRRLQHNYLSEMVKSGDLVLRYPDNPTHPSQSYKTK